MGKDEGGGPGVELPWGSTLSYRDVDGARQWAVLSRTVSESTARELAAALVDIGLEVQLIAPGKPSDDWYVTAVSLGYTVP